ncbi:hypothetical protein Csa_012187 [Cucumis sativus]|uniref:Uncharacterized protein n=1 Tax=Cucumis sativus TaxID=3659 RepID=A0A0A0L0E0_CUCSA|nr:hypothetical protein Csa_012187 [Cucumis sativus]
MSRSVPTDNPLGMGMSHRNFVLVDLSPLSRLVLVIGVAFGPNFVAFIVCDMLFDPKSS